MKKGEKMHIFSPIGKKYEYFFPNWLKIYKISQKKGCNFFRLRRAHHQISFGEQKYQSRREGGGQKYEFQILNTPLLLGSKNFIYIQSKYIS